MLAAPQPADFLPRQETPAEDTVTAPVRTVALTLCGRTSQLVGHERDVAGELTARLMEGVRIAVVWRRQTTGAIGEISELGSDVNG